MLKWPEACDARSRERHDLYLSLAGGIKLKPLTQMFRMLSVAAVLIATAVSLHAQNTLSATPSVVFLNATVGGALAQQPVTVTSSPALIPVTPTTTAPWLSFLASSPTTPASITFIGNPAGMAAGVYSTTVNLTSPSASTL